MERVIQESMFNNGAMYMYIDKILAKVIEMAHLARQEDVFPRVLQVFLWNSFPRKHFSNGAMYLEAKVHIKNLFGKARCFLECCRQSLQPHKNVISERNHRIHVFTVIVHSLVT